MKKIKTIFVACIVVMLALSAGTSCSSSEEIKDNCYFTVGVKDYSTTIISTADQAAITQYAESIESAYCKALGITTGNTITLSGDYTKVSAQMKAKFNAATLPTAPVLTGGSKYSFSYSLSGSDLASSSSQNTEIVSKAFSN